MSKRAFSLLLIIGALLLGGCTGYSGSLAQQVVQWANGASWSSDNAQILSDLTDLHNGLTEHQLAELRTACQAFPYDVDTLYDNLPTPDNELTNELNQSLTDFDEAAQDCATAPSFTSARFAKYERELATATALYRKAQQRLSTFGVR